MTSGSRATGYQSDPRRPCRLDRGKLFSEYCDSSPPSEEEGVEFYPFDENWTERGERREEGKKERKRDLAIVTGTREEI